jgi:EAL domain-containing protein (putative c-di-GMP-specific phosphodiesterase class I)
MLHNLKGLGVPMAINDFGTGHSALSYLLDMPFDTLDRSLAMNPDIY